MHRPNVRVLTLVVAASLAVHACGSGGAEPDAGAPVASVTAPDAAAPARTGNAATTSSPTGPPPAAATTTPAAVSTGAVTTPVPATAAPETAPPTTPAPIVPRVLLVGDSTLLAVEDYGALHALTGMEAVYEAASCRALAQPSCGDDPPVNSVEVIDRAAGSFDLVVIMAGYDEWYTTFADSFDRVVASARARGASSVVWLTYPEGVDYLLPDDRSANESLVNMNQIMRDKIATGAFPDVVVADWFRYAAAAQGWYSEDDIHLSRTGAYAVADYISRKVATTLGQACPMPRDVGGQIEVPCPDPDVAGPVADVVALYGA